jgi:hypothetical protein
MRVEDHDRRSNFGNMVNLKQEHMNWEVYKQDYIENVLRSNYDIKNNLGRN